jgi:hypothetical protein
MPSSSHRTSSIETDMTDLTDVISLAGVAARHKLKAIEEAL